MDEDGKMEIGWSADEEPDSWTCRLYDFGELVETHVGLAPATRNLPFDPDVIPDTSGEDWTASVEGVVGGVGGGEVFAPEHITLQIG